jgi:hypothetical protein
MKVTQQCANRTWLPCLCGFLLPSAHEVRFLNIAMNGAFIADTASVSKQLFNDGRLHKFLCELHLALDSNLRSIYHMA